MKKKKIYFIIFYTLAALVLLFIPIRERISDPVCDFVSVSIYGIIKSEFISSLNNGNLYFLLPLFCNLVFFTPAVTILQTLFIKYSNRKLAGAFLIIQGIALIYLTYGFFVGEALMTCVSLNKNFIVILFVDIFSALLTLFIGIFILTKYSKRFLETLIPPKYRYTIWIYMTEPTKPTSAI